MHREDQYVRDLISGAIRSAVDQTVMKHYNSITQEPALTARIGEAIEQRLNGAVFNDYKVRVVTQDIPDRGKGALERDTGIDLYIGLDVQGQSINLSKGMFIQAKWNNSISGGKLTDLVSQCDKMLKHTDKGAFVWLYGPDGTEVIPASDIIHNPHISPTEHISHSIESLFKGVMNCTSGDHKLVAPNIFHDRLALGDMLKEYRTRRGVAVKITKMKS
jgi:hypothetical protein